MGEIELNLDMSFPFTDDLEPQIQVPPQNAKAMESFFINESAQINLRKLDMKSEFVTNAIAVYQTYKDKNIETSDLELPIFEGFLAAFQLLEIVMSLRDNRVNLADVDFKYIQKLILNAFISNGQVLDLLVDSTDQFFEFFRTLGYSKFARAFYLIHARVVSYNESLLTFGVHELLIEYRLNNLYSHFSFIERFLNSSLEILKLKQDCKVIKEAGFDKEIFEELFRKMKVKDIYPGAPKMLETFKDAESLYQGMMLKFDYCKAFCEEDPANAEKTNTLVYIDYLKGQFYHILSDFPAVSNERIKLAEKSLKYWNKFKTNWCQKEQLMVYLRLSGEVNAIKYYSIMLVNNTKNLNRILVHELQNFMSSVSKLDSETVEREIERIDFIREEFIPHIQTFLTYIETYDQNPHSVKTYALLCYLIAQQFRAITENQLENRRQSVEYLISYYNAKKELSALPPSLLPLGSQRICFIKEAIMEIDDDEYIQKLLSLGHLTRVSPIRRILNIKI